LQFLPAHAHEGTDMTRVWIAQCLCGPQRHAIIATAGEAEGRAGAERYVLQPLEFRVASLLRAKTLNPWCGICRALVESWRYELGRTAFATMAEAMPALKRNEDTGCSFCRFTRTREPCG
jgi:hypothetical protein